MLRKIIVLFLFLSQFVLAQSFEGIVKFKISDGDNHYKINYLIKGDIVKIVMQGDGETASTIFTKDKMVVLIPSQKMYMEYSMDLEKVSNEQTSDDDFEKYKEKILNADDVTFLGRKCKKLNVLENGEHLELIVANDMGNFMFQENPMNGESSFFSDFSGMGFFPLKVIVKNRDGNVESELEATEIVEQKIDKSEFEIPSGFTKLDIQNMMKKK